MPEYRTPLTVEELLRNLALPPGMNLLTSDVVMKPRPPGGHLAQWVVYLGKIEQLPGKMVNGLVDGREPRLWVHRVELGFLTGRPTIGIDVEFVEQTMQLHVTAFQKELADGTARCVKDGEDL